MFRTVATVIGDAEASIPTVRQRHQAQAAEFWVNLQMLPLTNSLARLHTGRYRRFLSPLQRISGALHRASTTTMELIEVYVIAPWEARMKVQIESHEAPIAEGIQIATSSSARNGVVGMGGAISDTTTQVLNGTVLYSMTDCRAADRTKPLHGGISGDGGGTHLSTCIISQPDHHDCDQQSSSTTDHSKPTTAVRTKQYQADLPWGLGDERAGQYSARPMGALATASGSWRFGERSSEEGHTNGEDSRGLTTKSQGNCFKEVETRDQSQGDTSSRYR